MEFLLIFIPSVLILFVITVIVLRWLDRNYFKKMSRRTELILWIVALFFGPVLQLIINIWRFIHK
jgi:uncharacterized membrane protein YsdA (DUF1294 family)